MNDEIIITGFVLAISLAVVLLVNWMRNELTRAPTEEELWPDTKTIVARQAKKKELKDLMKTHGFVVKDDQVVCGYCKENCGQCAVTGRMRRAQELHESL